MKMKILSLLMLTFMAISLLHAEGKPEFLRRYFPMQPANVDITVGTKINDSTGQISITASEIQSSVIANIKFLSNALITNETPTIAVGQQFCYLVFQAVSVSSQNIEVAVELTGVGNTLKFQNISGKQIHVWQTRGTCSSCGFLQDWQKSIIDCNCNSSQSGDNSSGGCDHFIFLTE